LLYPVKGNPSKSPELEISGAAKAGKVVVEKVRILGE